ncbi:hypothetical protein RJ639_019072 [Escallonia herrerae]|uniref:Uncharacterized protein n=1 Tax=Escallonia herrerae TaxID=1293975 RepID=A0AA88V9F7_9ASTE|nr:hypothetical protein RJ639_019072 [Escallonia herrerae]
MEIHELLTEYQDVIEEPHDLPPYRSHDHPIKPVEGAKPAREGGRSGFTKMISSKGSKGYSMLAKTDTRKSTVSGVVPVYVGEEGNKYNVSVEFFSSSAIKDLLEKYKDELGPGSRCHCLARRKSLKRCSSSL